MSTKKSNELLSFINQEWVGTNDELIELVDEIDAKIWAFMKELANEHALKLSPVPDFTNEDIMNIRNDMVKSIGEAHEQYKKNN